MIIGNVFFCDLIQRDEDRDKAMKLLIKIFTNIINNPTNTQKYGDLHALKMMKKFARCKPAGDLLLLSGFQPSNDNKRLIWTKTTNNMMKIRYIYTTLSTMIDSSSATNNDHTQINGVGSIIPNLVSQQLTQSNPMTIAHSVMNAILYPYTYQSLHMKT